LRFLQIVARATERCADAYWRDHDSHRVRPFKLPTDPQFAAKVRDIGSLYVDPGPAPIVLSVDEKSEIQATCGYLLRNGKNITSRLLAQNS
jgi:hypothetical protein